MRRALHDLRSSRSALAGFVLLVPLLLLAVCFAAHLALVASVRSELVAAAAEGARAAASSASYEQVRSATLAAVRDLGIAVVRRVEAEEESVAGIRVLTVRIEAELPLIGLFGSTQVHAEAHGLLEDGS